MLRKRGQAYGVLGKSILKSQEELIAETLDSLGIEYVKHTHPPVFTVSEVREHVDFNGRGCKNLFLYDKRADKHYLVVMPDDKKAHSNTIRKQVKAGSLVFGDEEKLLKLLGVKPGSISPLGIVNDSSNEVTVLIDEDLPKNERVGFHPNINTATIELAYNDFEKFLKWSGNEYRFISVNKETE